MIYASGLFSVLLNGIPKTNFFTRGDSDKGIHFFVLAADLLQSIFNEAMENDMIKAPITSQACPDFTVVQYADDTILIMQANNSQLQHAKYLLLHFTAFIGLKVNYNSNMIPLNISQSRIQPFSNLLGCTLGTLPFYYVVMPLSLAKARVTDYMTLLSRISSRLARCSTFLSYGEKLVLIKSVFRSLAIFYMCTLTILVTILQQINKLLKTLLLEKIWYGIKRCV